MKVVIQIAIATSCLALLGQSQAVAQTGRVQATFSSHPTAQSKVINIFQLASQGKQSQAVPSSQEALPTTQPSQPAEATAQQDPVNDIPAVKPAVDPFFDPFAEPLLAAPLVIEDSQNTDPSDASPSLNQETEATQLPLPSVELEELPIAREAIPQTNYQILTAQVNNMVAGPFNSPINWVNKGRPSTKPDDQEYTPSNLNRFSSKPLTHFVRYKSPPQPVINLMQPAIIQVPVQIRVVQTYFDYPIYPYAPIYRPRSIASTGLNPHFPEEYQAPVGQYPAPAVYHMAPPSWSTQQGLYQVPDVNLVGNQSNSRDFVSYPHNFISYPLQSNGGLQIQSFPLSRRMDR